MAKFAYNQNLETDLGDFRRSLDLDVKASGKKAAFEQYLDTLPDL